VDNISLYQCAFVVSTALRCYVAGCFHHSFYPYTFAFSVVFFYQIYRSFILSDLQEFYFGAESVLCLEVSPLRLLEVDNVPDGIKVIRLDVLILKIEGMLPDVNTDDGLVGEQWVLIGGGDNF